MRILLIGTMGDIGATVKASLESHGLDVLLIEFPQNTFRDEPGYQRALKKGLESFQPHMILPIGHQLALSRMKQDIPGHVIVPVDSPQKIELLDSKVRSSMLAARLGVAQPRVFKCFEDAEAFWNASAASHPHGCVILKRDCSFGGSGVFKPWSIEALRRLVEHEKGRPFLLEEYVEGYDVSVDCIRMGGYFQAACYKSLSRRQGQGPSVERCSVECPEIQAVARKILDHVDYNGVCGMDFRIRSGADGHVCGQRADGSEEALFLECNPRFCGGLKTQIERGFDIPYSLVKAAAEYYAAGSGNVAAPSGSCLDQLITLPKGRKE